MEPSSPAAGPPAGPPGPTPLRPATTLPPAARPGPAPPPPRAADLLLVLLALLPIAAIGAFSLLAGALVMQLSLVLVTLRWARRSPFRPGPLLRLGRPPRPALLIGAGVGVAAMLAGSGVHALTREVLPERLVRAFDVGQALLDAGWSQAALIAVVSLLPALCEELAFRGGLLSALAGRGSPARAIALSALAFAAFHLDPVRLPAVLVLGLAFGWLAWRTGSLWPPVLAHALNNGAAVAGLLLVERAGRTGPAERLPPGEAAVLVAAGAAVFWLLLAAARRWLPPPPAAASFLVPRAATTAAAAPSPSGSAPP